MRLKAPHTLGVWLAGLQIGLWQNKRLLKRALQRRLPAEHLRAPKRGFVGPTAAWLRHELRDMIEDELAPARLQRLGYFDPSVVRGLLDDHFSRRHNRAGILWALLCFSIWHRGYVEALPAHHEATNERLPVDPWPPGPPEGYNTTNLPI